MQEKCNPMSMLATNSPGSSIEYIELSCFKENAPWNFSPATLADMISIMQLCSLNCVTCVNLFEGLCLKCYTLQIGKLFGINMPVQIEYYHNWMLMCPRCRRIQKKLKRITPFVNDDMHDSPAKQTKKTHTIEKASGDCSAIVLDKVPDIVVEVPKMENVTQHPNIYIYIYIKEFDCIWLHYDLVCGWYFLSYFHKYKTLQMHFACHGTYLRCHWLDTPVCRTSREEIWWSVTSWWFQHMWNMVVKLDDLPGRGKIDHIMYKIVTLQKNTYRICCFL